MDWFAFRPLLGWATAWSFDRLRRWIEDDTDRYTSSATATCRSPSPGSVPRARPAREVHAE